GEVGRAGDARHIGAAVDAAVWVHSDTASKVEGAAAEEGGVDQGTPCRVELRHEGVTRTAADTTAGARGGGEGDLVGAGGARRIGAAVVAAAWVHGDSVAKVVAATAAEEGGVDKGGACRVELRHEGVPAEEAATTKCGLEGARGRGEVG